MLRGTAKQAPAKLNSMHPHNTGRRLALSRLPNKLMLPEADLTKEATTVDAKA